MLFPSRYNVIIKDFPNSGQSLVQNTLRESMVIMDNRALELLDSGAVQSSISPGDINTLLSEGFLFEDRGYEESFVEYLFNARKYSRSTVETVIMTTEDCNLGCKYCTESGFHSTRSMSERTAERVLESLIGELKTNGTRRLTVDFFGGEPLMNPKPIEVIAPVLRNFCTENDIELLLRVTTNGTLLDRGTFDFLRRATIDKVQVTLDGVGAIHDYRKPTVTGEPSYNRIVRNLRECDEDYPKLQVRINVDKHNIGSVHDLLGSLAALRKSYSKQSLRVYVSPTELSFNPADDWNEQVFSPREKADAFCYIWDRMMGLGLPIDYIPTYYPCGTLTEWATVIGVEGEIYCCSGLAGVPEFQRGSIFSEGQIPSSTHLRLLTEDVWRQCISCKYLPLCGGGCRVQALIRTGDAFKIDCQKDFFDLAYESFLKAKYLAEEADGGHGV